MPFKDKLKDVDYFMNQMGHGIKDSFNEEQEKQIRLILAKAIRIPSKKILDINVPFWFFKKYYMQFYMGEDKRKGRRQSQNRDKSTESIIERDYRYFYSLLPPQVASSLNFEQKRAVQDILKRCIVVPTKKIYETNKTFRFGKKDYYVSFFLGFDKRKSHRSASGSQTRGLNLGVRGFIYFVELAIGVGILYTLFRIISALFNFSPQTAFEKGLMDEMIDEKIDDRINQGFSLPNPLQIIDYYWWNYLKPLI
jgi:hypothetical protein